MNGSADIGSRERWRGQPLSYRLHALSRVFILHDNVKAIVNFLDMTLPVCEARGKAQGLLVLAPSGGGKSQLIEYLKRLYPETITPTLTTRPVVAFKIPKTPSSKSMGTALLAALGDPRPNGGTADEQIDRIRSLVVKVGVRIIAIDDFQDVPARRKASGVAQISDWIRDLCDIKFPGIVIALGTPEAAVVRDAHDQLRRRMSAKLELPLFSIGTDSNTGKFLRLLKLLDAALPLTEGSELATPDMMLRLLRATNGNLSYLLQLLVNAVARAVGRGAESISLADLQQGFIDQHQVAASGGNPFNPDYKGQVLDQPGQVFHRASDEGATKRRSRDE